jgi:hypothetical protein
MKRPILLAGMLVGTLGLAGCQQSGPKEVARQSKPSDPTAWSDKDLPKGDSSDSGTSNGLSKSSRLSGTWSSEAQDVERSLGVGK